MAALAGNHAAMQEVFGRITYFIKKFTPDEYDVTRLEFAIHSELRGVLQNYAKVEDENARALGLLKELREHISVLRTENMAIVHTHDQAIEQWKEKVVLLEATLDEERSRMGTQQNKFEEQSRRLEESAQREERLRRSHEAQQSAQTRREEERKKESREKDHRYSTELDQLRKLLAQEKIASKQFEVQLQESKAAIDDNVMEASLRRRLQVTQDQLADALEENKRNESHWQNLISKRVGDIRREYDSKILHYQRVVLKLQEDIKTLRVFCD